MMLLKSLATYGTPVHGSIERDERFRGEAESFEPRGTGQANDCFPIRAAVLGGHTALRSRRPPSAGANSWSPHSDDNSDRTIVPSSTTPDFAMSSSSSCSKARRERPFTMLFRRCRRKSGPKGLRTEPQIIEDPLTASASLCLACSGPPFSLLNAVHVDFPARRHPHLLGNISFVDLRRQHRGRSGHLRYSFLLVCGVLASFAPS